MKKFIKSVIVLFSVIGLVLFSPLTGAVVRDIVFPVDGKNSFRNDYLEPRGGGTREHLGIDIIADKMTPLVSAVDGRVSYIVSPQASWGYSISITDSDGYQYRYLHLNNDTPGTDDSQGGEANAYAPGLRRGSIVTKGQHIGFVGDSGNAENTASHLHFEIRQPGRTAINPYDSLIAAKSPSSTVSTSSVNHASTSPIDESYFFTQDLAQSSRGEEVRQLQLRLQALGYLEESITGYYGPFTQIAVTDFQKIEGVPQTGRVDEATRALLNKGVAYEYVFTKALSVGSTGEEVTQLQIALQVLGYFKTTPTGYFGPITKAAVVSFQVANSVDPIGIVGPRTRAALNGF
jgi:peptidoglycan hydrolase-like protein with peptidoglycan-binding domain